MKFYKSITLLAFVTITFAQGSGSVGSADVRSAAMGNTYNSISRGIYALGKNPANLAIQQEHKIEIGTVLPLPNVSANIGNDFMTIDDFNYFFGGVAGENGESTGRLLDDNDKERFLALFDDGNQVSTDIILTLFSASYNAGKDVGAFSFSINDRASSFLSFPTELLDLALNGNETGKEYHINDANINSFYLRDYSFSYAKDITNFNLPLLRGFESVTAGISLKIVQGFAYTGIEKANTTITTLDDHTIEVISDLKFNTAFSPDFGVKYDFDESDEEKESNFGLFPSSAGSGFGLDFGINAKLDNHWRLSLAVTDIGSVNWNEETVVYESQSTLYFNDVTDDELVDSLADALTGKGRYSDGFSSSLPTTLRFGASFQFDREAVPGDLLIAVDYNQGLNDAPSNTTKPRFSIGFEWKPLAWMPLRSGFSFGGRDGFRWGAGIGFDAGFLEFNFASSYFNGILGGNSAKRIGVSVGTKWKF